MTERRELAEPVQVRVSEERVVAPRSGMTTPTNEAASLLASEATNEDRVSAKR